MSSLALLFARCHIVESAGEESLFGSIFLAHVGVGVVFLSALEEVAGVARVVDGVEGLKGDGAEVGGGEREGEFGEVDGCDAVEDFRALADDARS